MCNHVFRYPEDRAENYNPDGVTLTGVCKFCGAKQKSYGLRWMIPIEESFAQRVPYGATRFGYIDKIIIEC